MSYLNGEKVLPPELMDMIRHYVQGVCLYIPSANNKKQCRSSISLTARNSEFCARYQNGTPVRVLAGEYYLSAQAIYKIISKNRK